MIRCNQMNHSERNSMLPPKIQQEVPGFHVDMSFAKYTALELVWDFFARILGYLAPTLVPALGKAHMTLNPQQIISTKPNVAFPHPEVKFLGRVTSTLHCLSMTGRTWSHGTGPTAPKSRINFSRTPVLVHLNSGNNI